MTRVKGARGEFPDRPEGVARGKGSFDCEVRSRKRTNFCAQDDKWWGCFQKQIPMRILVAARLRMARNDKVVGKVVGVVGPALSTSLWQALSQGARNCGAVSLVMSERALQGNA